MIGVVAQRIAGWPVARAARVCFVLDAFDRALHVPRGIADGLSAPITYAEHLAEAAPSKGGVGNDDKNSMAETVVGRPPTDPDPPPGLLAIEAVESASIRGLAREEPHSERRAPSTFRARGRAPSAR
jgi:hypothetical protein